MCSWKNHADGLNLVDAGVGAVEEARDFIEADFAGNPLLEGLVEVFVHARLHHLAHAGLGRTTTAASGGRVGRVASLRAGNRKNRKLLLDLNARAMRAIRR